MAKRSWWMAVLLPVLFLCCEVRAGAGPEVVLLTEQMKPFNYKDDGEVRGISADIVTAALREAGIAYRLEILPWARAYERTQAEPGAFLFSMARTPEREKLFTWVAPLAPAQVCLFRMAARRDLEGVERKALPAYRLAAVRGYYTAEVLRQWGVPESNITLFPDTGKRAAIEHLELGRSDFFLGDPYTFGVELREAGKNALVIRHGAPVRVSDYYIAANLKTDPDMLSRVAAAMESFLAAGKDRDTRQKYLQSFALP